jgi:integrase
MKLDPYKHKERYLRWKEKIAREGCIEGLSKENSDIILQYLHDMEIGMNVATKSIKGARSPVRLNKLIVRMSMLAKKFSEIYGLNNITNVTELQVVTYFAKMRSGEIVKNNGEPYKSARDLTQVFKSFWHWWMKMNKKRGIEILDITTELDCSRDKPEWVYLTEKEVRLMWESSPKQKYKALIMFLFDTGIRAPTELMNIRVSDFYNDFKELNIRQEIAKGGSFGRRIKLMLCTQVIQEYIQAEGLSGDDYIFQMCPTSINRYLKQLATKLFGEEKTLAGQRYSEITMYDFRHCSCCYWLPRYKSESALKFRFGWKKSDKIHYYSEMLGMRDTIAEDDMLLDLEKTELENKLLKSEKEREVILERMAVMEKQMAGIMKMMHYAGDLKEKLVVLEGC